MLTLFLIFALLQGLLVPSTGRSELSPTQWPDGAIVDALPACRNHFFAVRVPPGYAASGILYGVEATPRGGALYRSTDGSRSWSALSVSGEDNFTMPVFSPQFLSDRTMFVRAWWPNRFLSSTDAGDTWHAHPLPDTPGIDELNPVSSTQLFLNSISGPPGGGSDQGVFYTGDLGQHWQHLWAGKVAALGLSPDFVVDQTLFQGDGGLYKSTDAGQTWQPKMEGLSGRYTRTTISQFGFSPDFGRDRTVFALEGQDIHRSTDAGDHWENLTNDVQNEGWSSRFIVSPRFTADRTLWRQDLILVATVFISRDTGDTWQQLPYELQLQDAAAVCNGEGVCGLELFATHYDRVRGYSAYRSYDYGQTWECLPPARHSLYLPHVGKTEPSLPSTVP